MKEKVQCTATYMIRLRYKCSKCKTDALALLPIQGEDNQTIGSFVSSKRRLEIEAEMRSNAYRDLRNTAKIRYSKPPYHWHSWIRGKCPKCGHIEPWEGASLHPHSAALGSCLGGLISIALLVGITIVGVMFDAFWLIPVIFLGVFGLILLLAMLPIRSPKKQKMIDALLKLPPEYIPQYEITYEEALAQINAQENSQNH